MAGDELVAFRKRWKEELELKKEHRQCVCVPSPSGEDPAQKETKNRYFGDSEQRSSEAHGGPSRPGESGSVEEDGEDQPEYVSIARGLLDGRTSPLLDRIQKERTRRKRQHHGACGAVLGQDQPQEKVTRNEKLVDQFIQDLVGEPVADARMWVMGEHKSPTHCVYFRMRSTTFPFLTSNCHMRWP